MPMLNPRRRAQARPCGRCAAKIRRAASVHPVHGRLCYRCDRDVATSPAPIAITPIAARTIGGLSVGTGAF